MILLGAATNASVDAQVSSRPRPVDAKVFPIVAWGTSPADRTLLQGIKDAGFNISGFCKVEDLEKVRQAGLSCLVNDKRAAGYRWEAMPPDAEVWANIVSLKRDVGDNPAAFGFYLEDEPGYAAMPALGMVTRLLKQALPDRVPYVNLFPAHAGPEMFGVDSYDHYVRRFLETSSQPFLSYDNYSLLDGEMAERYYENLEYIRRVSLESHRPFWNCILANAHFEYMEPTDATLRLQVYSTLAYGGRGIQYFTYFTPDLGNFRNGAVDAHGNRTPTWDMVRRVNNELNVLAPTMVRLQSLGVYHHPDAPGDGRRLAESRFVKELVLTRRYGSRPEGELLLGELTDGRGQAYLVVVNKSLTDAYRVSITLREESRKLVRISPASGEEQPLTWAASWLPPGGGAVLRIE